jgi:hypothetical protein
VTGNLGLDELAPALVALARREARADVRLAALVALAELAPPAVFRDLGAIARAEKDPAAFAAASRALAAIALADRARDVGALAGRLEELIGSPEPLVREAAVRLAGIAGGKVSAIAIARLATDPVPAVRAEARPRSAAWRRWADALASPGRAAVPAEGRTPWWRRSGSRSGAPRAGCRRAARGRRPARLEQVLEFVSGGRRRQSRAAIAPRIVIPPTEVALSPAGRRRARADRPEAIRSTSRSSRSRSTCSRRGGGGASDPAALDAGIADAFRPSPMVQLAGFDSLIRSIGPPSRSTAACRPGQSRPVAADHPSG